MKNDKTLLFAALAIGIYYYIQQSKATAALPSNSITTDAKRQAIIVYWETYEPPSQQATTPFTDIINNIAPSEVDTVYTYVFSYLAKGLQPTPGSAFALQINQIKTYYNIFS